MVTTMTGHDDTTGPADFGPEQGQGARSWASGASDTSDLKRGLVGPHERLALVFPDAPADAVALGVVAVTEALGSPAATVALVTRLADVEAERDELARKVEALSVPRVFNVAGLIEGDLAERYTNLREAHDVVLANHDAAVLRAEEWANECGKARKALDDAEKLHKSDLLAWSILWRPLKVGAIIERRRAGEELSPEEQAEIALWAMDRQGRAIRFVAELATMTDVEADFTDGHELRSTARLLQVPDMDGEVEATLPRLYSDADRQRARDAVYRRFYDPSREAVQSVATTTGELVDLVAEALGLRRAGA